MVTVWRTWIAFMDNVVSRPPINIRDMNIRDIATRALSEVELIPQFAEGGLAEILQAPTKSGYWEGLRVDDFIGPRRNVIAILNRD